MRNFSFFLFIFIISLSLAGCNTNSSSEKTSDIAEQPIARRLSWDEMRSKVAERGTSPKHVVVLEHWSMAFQYSTLGIFIAARDAGAEILVISKSALSPVMLDLISRFCKCHWQYLEEADPFRESFQEEKSDFWSSIFSNETIQKISYYTAEKSETIPLFQHLTTLDLLAGAPQSSTEPRMQYIIGTRGHENHESWPPLFELSPVAQLQNMEKVNFVPLLKGEFEESWKVLPETALLKKIRYRVGGLLLGTPGYTAYDALSEETTPLEMQFSNLQETLKENAPNASFLNWYESEERFMQIASRLIGAMGRVNSTIGEDDPVVREFQNVSQKRLVALKGVYETLSNDGSFLMHEEQLRLDFFDWQSKNLEWMVTLLQMDAHYREKPEALHVLRIELQKHFDLMEHYRIVSPGTLRFAFNTSVKRFFEQGAILHQARSDYFAPLKQAHEGGLEDAFKVLQDVLEEATWRKEKPNFDQFLNRLQEKRSIKKRTK